MTRDAMARLAAARPADLDPPPDAQRRTRDLHNAMSDSRKGHQVTPVLPRTKRKMTIRLGAVAAVGTAAAVAAVTAVNGSPNTTESPTPARLDDRSVFLAAAAEAEHLPTGKYWFSNEILGTFYAVHAKTGTYTIAARLEFFEWSGAKPGGGSAIYMRDLPVRPVTSKDEVAWRKAGAPKSFQVQSDDVRLTLTTPTTAGRWSAGTPGPKGGGHFLVTEFGADLALAEVRNLPTDPGKLADYLFTPRFLGPQAVTPSAKMRIVQHLLANAPVPPKVQAALMRALIAQEGVRAIGTVTDPLGRRGIALAADFLPPQRKHGKAEPREYGCRDQLIFDRDTGKLLATRRVLTKPGGIYGTQRPGFVINYQIIRRSGWVDTKPSPPAKLPFS